MKATDLMIGDWVKFTSKYGYGTGQIVGIEPREGSADPSTFTIYKKDKDGNTKFFVAVSRTCIEPIPLTPEILEKNGFDISDGEVMQYDFIEDGQKYHFTLRQMYNKQGERDGFSFFAFNVLTLILSIHELQHALRLCKIEKEIII
jgi:hypothetical protein